MFVESTIVALDANFISAWLDQDLRPLSAFPGISIFAVRFNPGSDIHLRFIPCLDCYASLVRIDKNLTVGRQIDGLPDVAHVLGITLYSNEREGSKQSKK